MTVRNDNGEEGKKKKDKKINYNSFEPNNVDRNQFPKTFSSALNMPKWFLDDIFQKLVASFSLIREEGKLNCNIHTCSMYFNEVK